MTSLETQEPYPFYTQDRSYDDDHHDTRSSRMQPSPVQSHSNNAVRPPSVYQGQVAMRASAVHGKGMWNNFLRSFSDPLYALLDLFDNAVDASWNIKHLEPKIKVDIDHHGGQGGIYIRNASSDPIPPMNKILEVFRSTKVHNVSAVGENGVGIKHACANLSNLSLVLTKTADSYSLGVLMKDLQQDVPHFPHFEMSKSVDIYGKIKELCERERLTWGRAVETYGDGDMYQGIDRIHLHFDEMKSGEWKDSSDVFTIIISKLRQTGHSDNANRDDDDDDLDLADEHEGNERSSELLDQFAKKLPQLYIHLNENIQVQVCGKTIDMAYWETRLASLTRFEVAIPQGPEEDPALKLTHAEPPYRHPTVRVWLGFNVYRPSASAHIYYYSRQSGRLIKDLADCRSMLKLISGSTDFKQGLTIIVDDYNSTLPLNPTKQDLSFAFREHGDTHKTNLNFWLSGISCFYWTYHFEKIANNSKRVLTAAVTGAAKLFDNAIAANVVHPLNDMDPIRFQALQFTQKKVNGQDEDGHNTSYTKLLVGAAARKLAQELVGQDTLVQLSDVWFATGGKKRARRASSPKKKKKAKMDDDVDDLGESSDEDSGEDGKKSPSPKKATARKSVKKSVKNSAPGVERQELEKYKKAKEAEIEELQTKKDEEIQELRVAKSMEKKARKEKERQIKDLLKEIENVEKLVLELREEKEQQGGEFLDKDKEILELRQEKEQQVSELLDKDNEILELREALEAARSAKGGPVTSREYSINVLVVNDEMKRKAHLRVPVEANRTIYEILQHDKVRESRVLGCSNEMLEKVKRKEAILKVGLWDPSREKGDYSYIYDVEETKSESTLQLFNFLKRDGMEFFREKYDPLHLYIFAEDKPTVKEDEGEFIL